VFRPKKVNHFTWRFRFILLVLALAAAALSWRMIDLMVLKRHFLMNQGDARMVRTVQTQAYRGMITDRFGDPLAISTPVDAAWADPQVVAGVEPQKLAQLAKVLELPNVTLTKLLSNKNREFIYLKRQLTPVQSDQVKALNIPGVFLKREYRRYYPEGEVTAHVVGLTNVDDRGQEGLELAYNKQLEGIPGLKRVIKDRDGHIVSELNELREPKAGQNVTLSIDRRVQYIAYRELKEGVAKYKAASGSAVVLDIHTGEVLAMVSQPSFNPNDRPSVHDGRFRNTAVTDVFEPGSTIKPFSVALGLDSGKFTPDTVIDTRPGWMRVGAGVVRDEHSSGLWTVTKILQVSSNMGVSKIILSLPPDSLYNLLKKMGLGETTGSGFPGERAGSLAERRVWAPFIVATLSFGYGLSVTTLQLAQLYAILGSGGLERPISFLKVTESPAGIRMLSEKTADSIVDMLKSVVEPGGTATRARVPAYWVSGKTGTARLVGSHGYEKDRHNVVFAGLTPATNPQLVVVVFVHDPQGKYSEGGNVAAPIFAKITSGVLRVLNIQPDHLGNQ
jgi:cell division protein FtsI (penicillin-binding protein 3)